MLLAASSAWDPVRAAGPGAAFSGLLAAIVVNSALRLAADKDRAHFRAGLAVAPLALLSLLVAGYLYILLAGEPAFEAAISVQSGSGAVPPKVVEAIALSPVRNAFLFAIAGSSLAFGAILTLFVVALVFSARHPGAETADPLPTVSATNAVIVGIGAVLVFLLFGYDDAREGTIAFGTRGLEGLGRGLWIGWLLSIATGSLFAGWKCEKGVVDCLNGSVRLASEAKRLFPLAVVFLYCAVLPVAAYSFIADVTTNGGFPAIELACWAGVAWIFLAAGVMVRHLTRRQPREV